MMLTTRLSIASVLVLKDVLALVIIRLNTRAAIVPTTAMDTDTAVRVSALRCGSGRRLASHTPPKALPKIATNAAKLTRTEFIRHPIPPRPDAR